MSDLAEDIAEMEHFVLDERSRDAWDHPRLCRACWPEVQVYTRRYLWSVT